MRALEGCLRGNFLENAFSTRTLQGLVHTADGAFVHFIWTHFSTKTIQIQATREQYELCTMLWARDQRCHLQSFANIRIMPEHLRLTLISLTVRLNCGARNNSLQL